jgi:hypothetical protein
MIDIRKSSTLIVSVGVQRSPQGVYKCILRLTRERAIGKSRVGINRSCRAAPKSVDIIVAPVSAAILLMEDIIWERS